MRAFLPFVLFVLLFQQNCISQFIEQTSIILPGPAISSAAWGDYDNDGDLDILFTGNNSTEKFTKIYRNNGDNTFSEQTSILLPACTYGSVAWGDYDNDGNLDILLTGETDTEYISKIFRNNGNNSFTEVAGLSLTGVTYSSCSWGDLDNDGRQDIIIIGKEYSPAPIDVLTTQIYRNTGTGFSLQANLPGAMGASVDLGDYDNDGDLDILITGNAGGSMNYVTKIYRNDGSNIFSEQTSISLYNVMLGSAVWGDYDNDGDLDIMLTGFRGPDFISRIYRNEGNNIFSEQTSIVFAEGDFSSAAWADYDNDGYPDVIISGDIFNPVTKIYRNNTNNSFTETFTLNNVSGKVLSGDYDNDGDLDLLITGIAGLSYSSRIFRNMTPVANTLPTIPANLAAVISGADDQDITFNWMKSTDNETPQNGLKYNMAIGKYSNGVERVSPMSDRNTGYRRLINLGNTNHNNAWTLKNAPTGRYYWSVQAIDNTFAASSFAAEKSFSRVTITLVSGWNLVTIPGLHPVNQDPLTWFPNLNPLAGVYRYNGGYQQVTSFIPGEAYWIKHTDIKTYVYLVEIVLNDPIPIKPGWNFIGVYDYPVSAFSLTTTPAGLITGMVYGYNGGYVTANTLYPFRGYIIKSTGFGYLNIPGPEIESE